MDEKKNWTIKLGKMYDVDPSEMRLLRPPAGFTIMDKMKNSQIREESEIVPGIDMPKEWISSKISHQISTKTIQRCGTPVDDIVEQLSLMMKQACRFNPHIYSTW